MKKRNISAIIALAMVTILFAGCTANTTQTPNETTVATQATLSHLEIRAKLEELSGYKVEYRQTADLYVVNIDDISEQEALELSCDASKAYFTGKSHGLWELYKEDVVYLSKELKAVVEGYGQNSKVQVGYYGYLQATDGEITRDMAAV